MRVCQDLMSVKIPCLQDKHPVSVHTDTGSRVCQHPVSVHSRRLSRQTPCQHRVSVLELLVCQDSCFRFHQRVRAHTAEQTFIWHFLGLTQNFNAEVCMALQYLRMHEFSIRNMYT